MNELHSILNSIAVGLSLLGILWLAAVKITRLEVKVDTMWGMLLKRAVVEGVHAGLMEVNSPIRLVNNSGAMLAHMAGELRVFYQEKCKGLSEPDATMKIEEKFGDRLAKEICIPNGISFGACIIMALMIAKNVETLTEIIDYTLSKKTEKKPK